MKVRAILLFMLTTLLIGLLDTTSGTPASAQQTATDSLTLAGQTYFLSTLPAWAEIPFDHSFNRLLLMQRGPNLVFSAHNGIAGASLYQLQLGDPIVLMLAGRRERFEVASIQVVITNFWFADYGLFNSQTMTLFTCYPQSGPPAGRLVVKAVREFERGARR